MSNIEKNGNTPYIAGEPTGKAAFIGRKGILQEICDILEKTARKNNIIELCALPSSGKTSLLKYLQQTKLPNNKFYTVYVDFGRKTARHFWTQEEAEQEITRAMRTELGIESEDVFSQLDTALQESGKKFVFLIDDFDKLAHSEKAKGFFKWFQILLNDTKGLNCVVSRACNINASAKTAFSYLSNTRRRIYMSVFNEKETKEVIRQSEISETLFWSDEAVNKVFQLTGGHPYFTQALCEDIWFKFAHKDESEKKPKVSIHHVESIIPGFLRRQGSSFDALWSDLLDMNKPSPEKKTVFSLVISEKLSKEHLNSLSVKYQTEAGKNQSEPRDVVRILNDCKLIDSVGEEYRFQVEILRLWIDEYQISPYSRSQIRAELGEHFGAVQGRKPQERSLIILHLSDIHFKEGDTAETYLGALKDDLSDMLSENERLDYLVISGDIATHSLKQEYETAVNFVQKLAADFLEDIKQQVIIVPGNHDLNWELSRQAYTQLREDGKLSPEEKQKAIRVPFEKDFERKADFLLADDMLYKKRFKCFSEFYNKICKQDYPMDYEKQAVLHRDISNKPLFLALNSSWEIDHYHTERAGINPDALEYGLGKISREEKDCLKIAVCHHPAKKIMMDNGFLDRLAQNGFKLCLCGHVHKAEMDNSYFYEKKVHIIGAGTFGAPAREQQTGIPLQYNLLSLYPAGNKLKLATRSKEKIHGPWGPDYRWPTGKTGEKSWERWIEL